MNTQINRLPVPTWNRTGVNWLDQKALPPDREYLQGRHLPYDGILPHGITLMDHLPADVAEIKSGMGEWLDELIRNGADKTCYLLGNGIASEPIIITQNLDLTQPVIRTHYAIKAKPGSNLTVVQINRGDAKDGVIKNLTQIDAQTDSFVRLISIQLLGKNSQSFDAVGARIGKGAKVELIRAVFGGKTAACGSMAHLEGQGGGYQQDTAYFTDEDQIFDFNDIASHIGRETVSEMHTAGVLSGHSSKILRGTIDFKAGSAHSVGHENETVLLLSPSARNRTVPLILCGEEAVEGQHAATLGRFDEKQLYYLCSRGLSIMEAKRLLVEARFMPVLNKITQDDLRQEILTIIERRLDEHEISS